MLFANYLQHRISETDFNDASVTTDLHAMSSVLPALAAVPLRSLQNAFSNSVANKDKEKEKEKEKDALVPTKDAAAERNTSASSSSYRIQQLVAQQQPTIPLSRTVDDGIEAVNITNTRSAINLTSSISMLFGAVSKSLSGALSSVLSLQPGDANTMGDGMQPSTAAGQNDKPQQSSAQRQLPTQGRFDGDMLSSAADEDPIDETQALRNEPPQQCRGKQLCFIPNLWASSFFSYSLHRCLLIVPVVNSLRC